MSAIDLVHLPPLRGFTAGLQRVPSREVPDVRAEQDGLSQTHGVFREISFAFKDNETCESSHASFATVRGCLRSRRRSRFGETREVEIHLVITAEVVEHLQAKVVDQMAVSLEDDRGVLFEAVREIRASPGDIVRPARPCYAHGDHERIQGREAVQHALDRGRRVIPRRWVVAQRAPHSGLPHRKRK
jgi:hypothetical protein